MRSTQRLPRSLALSGLLRGSWNHRDNSSSAKVGYHTKTQKSRLHHKKQTPNQLGRSTVLETGLAYFFYRPLPSALERAKTLGIAIDRHPWARDDIAKLHMLLVPKLLGPSINSPNDWLSVQNLSRNKTNGNGLINPDQVDVQQLSKRLIDLPDRRLPDIGSQERLVGKIDLVSSRLRDIRARIEGLEKSKRGRRSRVLQSRRAAEGVYALVEHEKHTHLTFVMEMPLGGEGTVQDTFNIKKEASYLVLVRNPLPVQADPQQQIKEIVEGQQPFPEEPRRGEIATSALVPVNPPSLLDQDGAELLIVGVEEGVEGLGHAGELVKEIHDVDMRGFKNDKLFQELHLHGKEHLKRALTDGIWK